MAASFPASVKSFGPAHQDFTENILAAHVNDVQDEVVAIENNLGALAHQGTNLAGGTTTYASVKARIEDVMAGVRAHTHSGTSGVKLDQANTHQNPDTNASLTALHHTLGTGPFQAAAGDHSHGSADANTVNTHIAATAAHGATGAVMGTTNTQTVQNKTFDGTNSFPSTLATLTGAQAMTNKDLTSATNTFPTSLATLTGTQALTNKTINLGSNTLTGTLAQFSTAVSDADLVGVASVQTLTNKTISGATIDGGNIANAGLGNNTLNGSIGGGGSISLSGSIGIANGSREMFLGYGNGISIGANGTVGATHPNGIVLWCSTNYDLYLRKPGGGDVRIG